MQLSKSDYMMFLRHPAWLWLKKHDKDKLPPVDEALQSLFDEGHLFESYAEKLFPNSVKVGFNEGEYGSYLSMVSRTKELINNKDIKFILQGRLEAGKITCIFDVLERITENKFNLYEIKSSTQVKEEHIYDLAFQMVVLKNAGLNIDKIFVVHVNNKYVRNGEINTNDLSIKEDVTEKVKDKIEETLIWIDNALLIMKSDIPPDYSPRHCKLGALDEWMGIYELLFPQTHPHNIFKLTWLNPKMIGILEDLGVKSIQDIPPTVRLNKKQQIQVKATKEDKRTINRENIKKFLGNISYPLYFLDYETFSKIIPPFDGLRPYQQIPFQYSLHIIEAPNGELKHKQFLHTENSHPTLSLLNQLKQDIGKTGSVLVWFEGFEKGRNKDMALLYPEYTDFIQSINDRVIDLMVPFYEGWFVDKDFFGSASIKKVLPVLISDLSYEKLEIKEGNAAQRLWMETVFDNKNIEKKEKIMKDLLDYCRIDTLAMVQLFKFLEKEIV